MQIHSFILINNKIKLEWNLSAFILNSFLIFLKKSKILSQKKIISKGCILLNITSLHQNYTSYVFEYQRIKNS